MDFAPGPQAPGYYSFPFCLQLPDWLPSSFHHDTGSPISGKFKTEYRIKAYFEKDPNEIKRPAVLFPDLEFSKPKEGPPKFSCERQFHIFRAPPAIVADVNSKVERSRMVGGLFGARASSAIIKVYFQKSYYVPGEVANVRFVIDNSNCKCAVWGLKLKLQRSYKGFAPNHGYDPVQGGSSSILESLKELGECPAGGKTDRTMQIRIPMSNPIG